MNRFNVTVVMCVWDMRLIGEIACSNVYVGHEIDWRNCKFCVCLPSVYMQSWCMQILYVMACLDITCDCREPICLMTMTSRVLRTTHIDFSTSTWMSECPLHSVLPLRAPGLKQISSQQWYIL